MRKLFYMGLEPYEARYTLQLTEWFTSVLKDREIDYVVVEGDVLDKSKQIVTGQVLDAHGRSFYSLTQMANLVKMMQAGEVNALDVIFFEDMFTPGIESLPYIMNQVPPYLRPKVWVRCLAQTVDPDDFVHVWDMYPWMSKYEHMVNDFVTGIMASSEEMVAMMKVAGWKARIYNISGLAFGKKEVQSRVKRIVPFGERPKRVAFSSRWDQEKQPHFFMDLIECNKSYDNSYEWVLLQGGPLRSNDKSAITRARAFQEKGWLTIHENLDKNSYYEHLTQTRVLFNCALQDWVSNTVSEADALGCNVVFPAYRSFPEIFQHDHLRLYIPWSTQDALNKIDFGMEALNPASGRISNWTDGTSGRIIDILLDEGEGWSRNAKDYRKWVRE